MVACSILFSLPAKSEIPEITLKDVTPEKTITISLEDVVSYVDSSNYDVQIAENQSEQAKYGYYRSYARLLPSIRGQLPVERFDGGEVIIGANPVSIDRTTYRPTVSANYSLSTAGKEFFNIGIQKNIYKRTINTEDRIYQETLFQATRNYFEWVKDNNSVFTAQKILEESENTLSLNKNRLKTGFGTKLEVLQSETTFTESKLTLLQAENNKNISEINLLTMLNIPFSFDITPDQEVIKPINLWAKDFSLDELFDIAKSHRPDIKEIEYIIKEAKNEYNYIFGDLFPTVSVSGYLRGIGETPADLERTVQGQVAINIDLLRYLGVETITSLKATKAKVKEKILQKEKRLNTIYSDIARARTTYLFHKAEIESLKAKIESSQEALRIAKARLKTGVGINLEIIQAESNLAQSELAYETAIMNYNISQVNLLLQCGLLTPKYLLKGISALE